MFFIFLFHLILPVETEFRETRLWREYKNSRYLPAISSVFTKF
jgi:hypothetical protein